MSENGFTFDDDFDREVEVEVSNDGWVEVWVNGSFAMEFEYLGDVQDHSEIEDRIKSVLNQSTPS